MSNRTEAMEWWNSMPLETQFYKAIECNHLLVGDTVDNHPHKLTGSKIELIYNHLIKKWSNIEAKARRFGSAQHLRMDNYLKDNCSTTQE